MPGDSNTQAMSRDDLYLLMQSYENTIQLNTTLLNQHQKLLEDSKSLLNKHSEVIRNIDSLTNKQQKVYEKLVTVIDKITELSEHQENNIANICTKIETTRIESLREHGQHRTRLMVISVILGSFVVTLITIIGQLWTKYEVLNTIAKSLGVY